MLEIRPRSDAAPDPDPSPDPGFEPPKARRLSEKLSDVAEDVTRERVSVGDLLAEFGPRSFGAAIFVFALPNALPISVPGVSAVFGLPLVILTVQLIAGGSAPWLPGAISRRNFARADFARVIRRLAPWLAKVEAMVRPRLLWLTEPRGERVIGALGLLLALVLFLPIPFGNTGPGIALTLMALGMIERDGVAALIGAGVGVASLALVSGVAYGAVEGALLLARSWIGL